MKFNFLNNQFIVQFFSIICFLLITVSCLAQTNSFINNISIKPGFSIVNKKNDGYYTDKSILFDVSISYKLNRYINAGIYIGKATLMHQINLPYNPTTGYYEWYSIDSTSSIISNGPGGYTSSSAVFYGIKSEIHLLPLFFKKELKFDVYLTPQFGCVNEKYEVLRDYQEHIWSPIFWEYGIGMGIGYRFTEKLGVFMEYSIGKYYNTNKNRFTSGISISL